MKLIVKCANCRHENKAPHSMDNRIDYAKQHGDSFSLTCIACNQTNNYHVDNIKAVDYTLGEIVKNRLMVLAIIFGLALVAGFFLGGIPGGVILSVISIIVSIVFVKRNNSSKNLTFNKHKLKGRVSGVEFKK